VSSILPSVTNGPVGLCSPAHPGERYLPGRVIKESMHTPHPSGFARLQVPFFRTDIPERLSGWASHGRHDTALRLVRVLHHSCDRCVPPARSAKPCPQSARDPRLQSARDPRPQCARDPRTPSPTKMAPHCLLQPYASGYTATVQAAASARNLKIGSIASFSYGDDEGIERATRQVADVGYTIILGIFFEVDLEVVMRSAQQNGVLNGDHACGSLRIEPSNRSGCCAADQPF
jgi:hypothetical protein